MSQQWPPPPYDPRQHQQRIGIAPDRQQAYPPPSAYPHAQQQSRKRRRVFMWVFLAIQALFLIWIIAGVHGNASGQGSQVHAQAVSFCSDGGWKYLYPSYAKCVASYGNTLNDASDAGTALGVGLIIGLWVAVDVITGIGYGVYRLSRRRA